MHPGAWTHRTWERTAMADETLHILRQHATWFEPATDGFASLFESIGDADIVLIGEASHGTHEFYRTRAELTKALVERGGFNIIAAEADWPDAYRVNRWVRHASGDSNPEDALGDFVRFPRWMWRNRDVVEIRVGPVGLGRNDAPPRPSAG